jgi:Ser/Thr protein kinase RdoA (MazF antagonist)
MMDCMAEERSGAEVSLTGGGRTPVSRVGPVVHRAGGPWTPAVHALLRHLRSEGFDGAPQVVGSGFDDLGRETLSFIEGEFVHPGPWPSEASLHTLGRMLGDLHRASATFHPPVGAAWQPWFVRDIAGDLPIIGHCDVTPWNVVARAGQPVALIDWEFAGPIDLMAELAQAAWLNAQLHDDDLAESAGLPSAPARLRQLRAFTDGYELSREARTRLAQAMIDFAVHSAAWDAIEGKITPSGASANAWGVAWRARSAAWMVRNREAIGRALS